MAKTSDQQQLSTMDLAPSQTINSKRRNRGKPKAQNSGETQTTESSQKNSAVDSSTKTGKPEATLSASASASVAAKPAVKKKRSQRKKNPKPPKEAPNAQENGNEPAAGKKKQPIKSNNNNKGGGRNKRNNPRKKYPWRKHLPTESVDPITLETLDSLTYPPFALFASAPHLPIPEWPIPEHDATEHTNEPASVAAETEEDRQRRIISEQWGHKLPENKTVVVEEMVDQDEKPLAVPAKRHLHLYDGRALAYYMVSQLQFIDPLNRRDLTRDELVTLDRYLRRHNFDDINVTEAYDTKGVTLSTAGATANTAAGRVAILQQLAGNLLNGLFGRSSVSHQQSSPQASRPAAAVAAPASTNRLMMQYQAHEQQSQEQNYRRRNHNTNTRQDGAGTDYPEDLGIYGDAGGLLVIDDDLHPGLRSNAVEFVPTTGGADGAADGSNLFWSASHIAARYGHAAMVQQENFPSLSARSTPAESPPELSRLVAKKPTPYTKTLSRITKTIRKTDPDEVQRQWEAREDSRRKAALSKLTFGGQAAWDTVTMQEIPSSLPPPTTTPDGAPTEAQLERNRAFAEALGVAPATIRTNINAGWARPTQTAVELDEFGHELNATVYPDSLIMYARENMGPVLKLERKWTNFLSDDKASSLSMNHMDKPLRKRVHEYSDFWKLQTESFDAEPKRYIYCAKLRDTCAPHLLLSDAARNWRGPKPILQSTSSVPHSEHAFQETAGQGTHGRELASGPDRVPLSLKPRSQTAGSEPTESLPGTAISGARTLTMTEPDAALNSRFGALDVGRARPTFELQKRTLPLELPAYEQPKAFDFSEEVQRQKERVEARERKEREAEERKQRALEAAFDSSDEEGDGGRAAGDDDSEWSEDEQEPLYTGEDEEEE